MLREARKKEEEETSKVKGKEKMQTPPRDWSPIVTPSPIFSYQDFELVLFYDILIFSESWEEHESHLDLVFSLFKKKPIVC